jgi:site-specific recombinase XerD
MLAMLFGCGFRRSELVGLELDEIQMRQGHWAVVDLIGKGGHIRTVPLPEWVKSALDQWTVAASVTEGRIFRAVARAGKVWGKGISQNVVWYVVKTCCERAGLEHIAPHDLRRLCQAVPHERWRVGADSILAGACIRADDGTLSRLQTESRTPGQRSF